MRDSEQDSQELIEMVEKLWWTEQINKENWTAALIEAVKYLIDRLILKDQKISEDQEKRLNKLISFLSEIKIATQEYAKFFESNKEQIKSIVERKKDITVLSEDLYHEYSIISWFYDYIDKELINILETLKNTSKFFVFSNFSSDDEDKNLVLDLIKETEEKEKPEEKLKLLEKEIADLEKIVFSINKDLDKFSNLIFVFKETIKQLNIQIENNYKKTKNNISWFESYLNYSKNSNLSKVYFEYKDSELLTHFFWIILNKIPENYNLSQTFKKDLIRLFTSKKIELIENDILITPDQVDIIKSIHSLYSELSNAYKKISDTIGKKYEKEEKKQRFRFEKNEENELKWYQILDVFKDKRASFFETLDLISRKDKNIFDIEKEYETLWTKKERKIKKDIFDLLYSIYEDIHNNEWFDLEKNLKNISSTSLNQIKIQNLTFKLENSKLKNKERKKLEKELENLISKFEWNIFEEENIDWENFVSSKVFNQKIYKLITLAKKFQELREKEEKINNELKKEKNKQQDRFRHHYSISSWWDFDTIDWFSKENVEKPAKVVWATARIIIDKIKYIAKNAEKFKKIKTTFPWAKDTLEWNLIVLWPWWGWKTALLKELSYQKNLITIEVNKSDILSTWLWQTEKNIDKLWKEAVKLHKQTGKEVFLFFDEMDSYFKWLWLTGWGPDIQKELQTRLDWLEDFEWVHFIWLSNVPHKIPIDIYRRMEQTYVLSDLDLQDKIDLFYSRLSNFPISNDLTEFLAILKEVISNNENTIQKLQKSNIVEDHVCKLLDDNKIDDIYKIDYDDRELELKLFVDNLWLNRQQSQILLKLFSTTPKILYQVTERVFKNYIANISKKQAKKLDKMIDKMNKKKIFDEENIKASFVEILKIEINLDDFKIALEQVFKNKSVESEIKWNTKFFKVADRMLNAITSNAFDWFDDDNDDIKHNNNKTITIIQN